MTECHNASRRETLTSVGLAVATVMAGCLAPSLAPSLADAHQGHDHAPRTILDLKGKLVRIVGPNDDVGDTFIEDRVTIHVNAEGRIVDLVYG